MRNRYVLLADLFAFVVAVFAAFGLRFDWYFFQHRPEFVPYVLAAPVIKAAVFYAFGMYGRFWRYATIDDLIALLIADSSASVAMAVFVFAEIYYLRFIEFSRSVLAADWLFALCATGAIRLAVRVLGEAHGRRRGALAGKRVLVVGAGDAGAIVTREMQRNPQLAMQPVGFVDDDPVKIGKRIYGVPVVGNLEQLRAAIDLLRADEVIIAMPRVSGAVLRGVTEECRLAGIASRTMPGVFELLGGNVSVSRLRQVDITDLLRRSPIEAEPDVSQYVHGRTVLVTGAGGSIGFELCRQVAHSRPRCLVLLGHGENSIFEAAMQLREVFGGVRLETVIADIRDRARLFRVFDALRPEIVFHAAAHKHVPLMETNPEEAITNNVLGTQNVLDAATRVDCRRFVLISSDKAVTPSSLMGASKRMAEALVRDAAARTGHPYVVVRFGNVLGSRGSVVPAFKRRIEQGGPIYVTHPDMKRFFMTIPEAVHLVLQAGGMGKGGELFVLKMGEPLRIVQLAQDLIRLSGLALDEVSIVFTGLRPGEKLEESLWDDGAIVESTDHPEVLRVTEPRPPGAARIADVVGYLANAARSGDRQLIDAGLAEIVPAFAGGYGSSHGRDGSS